MAYPNLKAEMARNGISNVMLAKFLEIRPQTLTSWMNEDSDSAFPLIKAKKIRDELFEDCTLDYLFSDEAQTGHQPIE